MNFQNLFEKRYMVVLILLITPFILYTQFVYSIFLFYNLPIVFQGFPIESVGPMEALMSIFSYELQTGKTLSVEDIQAGKAKDLITKANIEKGMQVSTHCCFPVLPVTLM